MSSCKFCEDYASHVNIREFKRKHPEIYGAQLEYEIAVVMLIRSWIPGRKRFAGCQTDYRCRGCGFVLNYCPECGKLLKKAKKAKEDGEV